MMRPIARVVAAIVAVCGCVGRADAQDTIPVRHLLALNVARLEPFRRSYDIIVYQRDSSVIIGSRDVSLEQSELAGTAGWLLVERRTGAVPAAESVFVAPDVRPVRWSSSVGPARLAAAFVGDTIMGATTVGSARQNIRIVGRPDLLLSGAMVELALGLLPLHDQWRDSAAVIALGLAGQAVVPVELTMLGSEELQMDSVSTRATSVVALRSEQRSVLYWVDAESGAVLRMQQVLPPHVGTLLEYRIRPSVIVAP